MTTMTVDLSTARAEDQFAIVRAIGAALANKITEKRNSSIPLTVQSVEDAPRISYGGVLWPAVEALDLPRWPASTLQAERERAAEVARRTAAIARGGVKAHHAHLPGGSEHKIPESLVPYMHTIPEAIAAVMKAAEHLYRTQHRWDNLQADLQAIERGEDYDDQSEASFPAEDRMTKRDLAIARARLYEATTPILWAGLERDAMDYLLDRAGYNVAVEEKAHQLS